MQNKIEVCGRQPPGTATTFLSVRNCDFSIREKQSQNIFKGEFHREDIRREEFVVQRPL